MPKSKTGFWGWYAKKLASMSEEIVGVGLICASFCLALFVEFGREYYYFGNQPETYTYWTPTSLWFLLLIPIGVTLIAHAVWRDRKIKKGGG